MGSDAQYKVSFKDVNLRGAKITGLISMIGASFDGKLDSDALQVGGMLLMRSEGQNKASFKEVVLRGADHRTDRHDRRQLRWHAQRRLPAGWW
jgi:hypothetical protein